MGLRIVSSSTLCVGWQSGLPIRDSDGFGGGSDSDGFGRIPGGVHSGDESTVTGILDYVGRFWATLDDFGRFWANLDDFRLRGEVAVQMDSGFGRIR